MKILFVADIHSRFQEFINHLYKIRSNFRIEACIVLGDFGFCEFTINYFIKNKIKFPMPVYVIDGNHEDHDFLVELTKNKKLIKTLSIKHNLIYIPRASIFKTKSTNIGFLGGALNINKPQKLTSQSSNYILQQEIDDAITLFNTEQPQIIATHSCPAGIGIGIKTNNHLEYLYNTNVASKGYNTLASKDDCGETELYKLWSELKIKPKLWIFGHFHQSHLKKIDNTEFIAVPEFINPPLCIIDTETLLYIQI